MLTTYIFIGTRQCAFPCMILLTLSLDLIVTYFPRRVSLSVMAVVVLLLLFGNFEVYFYEMTARI